MRDWDKRLQMTGPRGLWESDVRSKDELILHQEMRNQNLRSMCLCPAGSLNAMRFLTAVSMEQPEVLEKVSRELWMRIWSRVRAGLWSLEGRGS